MTEITTITIGGNNEMDGLNRFVLFKKWSGGRVVRQGYAISFTVVQIHSRPLFINLKNERTNFQKYSKRFGANK